MHRGYITLLSVLIVGAAGLVIVTSLLLLGIDASRANLVLERSYKVKAITDACAEEALQRIRDSKTYQGTHELTIDDGECAYTVVQEEEERRIVEVSGSINTTVRKVRIVIGTISPRIQIESWREVADF